MQTSKDASDRHVDRGGSHEDRERGAGNRERGEERSSLRESITPSLRHSVTPSLPQYETGVLRPRALTGQRPMLPGGST